MSAVDQIVQHSVYTTLAGSLSIMSDSGVAAEDERSQIKDDGGDDEVRDGPFIHTLPQSMRRGAWEAGGFARL